MKTKHTYVAGQPHWSATSFTKNCWIEISKSALIHNINQYLQVQKKKLLLMPVIKANAYGHGLLQVGSILNEEPTIEGACVALLSEAIKLRENGFTKKILVLNIIDADPLLAIKNNIEIIATDLAAAQTFNAIAQKAQQKITLHLKIDTGLSRMGVLWNEAENFVKEAVQLKYCNIAGIFTHFANVESQNRCYAELQRERFYKLINALKKAAIPIPSLHYASSAAQTAFDTTNCSIGRLGIGLYGLWPSSENRVITHLLHPSFSLKPVMEWKTHIIFIKTLPAHSFVGYDLSYQTNRTTTIAVLPVGYADGYNRLLTNQGIVKVKDQYAPVIGKIAMNLTIIDITDCKNITVADEVLLLGDDPRVNATIIAQQCSTINYEIVTRTSQTIERIIVD